MWFDFVVNPFALFSLLTSLLVAGLIGYIGKQRYQTTTLRWLLLTLMVIWVWSTAEFFIRISASPETARFFKYWEIAGYILLGPAAVGLCLAYVGKEAVLRRWKWLLALFVPAIFFIFAAWTQDLFVDLHSTSLWHRTWYGEWAAPLSSLFTYAYVPWLNVLLLISAFHLIRYYRQQSNPIRKRGALIFMLGVIVPSVVALITDQLWQVITGVEMLEMATLTLGISGVWITYGILKYQLFEVNPATIATNILETMNEVVVVCSPDLVVDYVSRPVKELLDIDSFSMIGQPFHKYVIEGWEDVKRLAHDSEGSGQSVEVKMSTPKKSSIPVGISSTAYTADDGAVLAHVFVLVDLTQLQELLSTTEERDKLQATLSSMTDGVIGITPEGAIELVNEAFCSMLSLEKSEVLGRPLAEVLEMRSDESEEDLMGEMNRELTNENFEQRAFNAELVSVVNNHQIEAELKMTRLPEKKKVKLAAIITVHNVTEERRLREMKADFTALAAHELRTPLTAIRGYTRLLQDEAKSVLSDDHVQLLDRLDVSSRRLSDLVNRLLEVSAIEQGRFKVTLNKVDIAKIIQKVLVVYQQKATQEKWTLESSLPPGEVLIDADADRIEQVLHILLDNAIAYSGESPRVGFIMRADSRQVVLSVVDNGQGILPELQQSLFEPYSRQLSGLQQTKQGAGLSLHIAKSIVDLHGGEISVKSEVDKGSVFTVVLPRRL